ncbi:peptide deformylase [Myxococcota bacterium]|nr:peptide deformylase [Myxococcota bacterium]MBU1413814.1 peptide deformylase [Myxococcota bacterium]MBU1510741.1 peptide deformylase [Myxococcota bacterium]
MHRLSSLLLPLIFLSCAGNGRATLTAAEGRLIDSPGPTLEIVTWDPAAKTGAPVLRQKALKAAPLLRADRLKIDRLMRATLKLSGGVGLAAPQVGLPLRIILVELQDPAKTVITCLDPVLEMKSPSLVDGYEGCLSIPGKGGKVLRHESIQVKCLSLDGRVKIYESTGFEARIFQHELDHLDGVLYSDKLSGDLMPIEEMRRLRAAEKAAAEGRDNGKDGE